MPVHNAEPYLGAALDSILGQSWTDLEFVVVDDGSTDGSRATLERYAGQDPRLRLLASDRNEGIVRALNRGLAACSGEYIARMDGDDIALPDRLARQVAYLRAHPEASVVGGALSYIDAAGRELGVIRRSDLGRSLLAVNPLFHPTVMLRRTHLQDQGLGYEERFRYAEDYYLWLLLSTRGQLAALDEVVLKYRLSAAATRFQNLKPVLLATLRVKAAAIARLGLRPTPADLLRFAAEALLLLLPAAAVRWLYLRTTFGKDAGSLAL
jgi:glycosyltransferase involved in cell wall biosynthesis